MPQQGSEVIPDVLDPSRYSDVVATILNGEQIELVAVRTICVKFRPPIILTTGNKIRLTVAGPGAGIATLSKTYIGPASIAAANAWQFSAATQITWNGGAADLTAFGGGAWVSDIVNFSFDASAPLIVAFELPIGSRAPFGTIGQDNVISFYKDGVSESASLAKGTGYTPLPGFNFFIQRLEASNA